MMHASFLGLSLPWLLFPAIAALVLSRLIRHLLALAGVYRWIWHPPLFDLALDVLTFCASVRLIQFFTQ